MRHHRSSCPRSFTLIEPFDALRMPQAPGNIEGLKAPRARRHGFTLVELLACQPKRTRRARRQARPSFTLVELLVVVAIIAFLIALLMPALKHARLMTYRADCANNLRQVLVAFGVYAQDTNDHFPYLYYWWRILGRKGYAGDGELHGGVTTPGPSGWKYRETRWPIFRCRGEPGSVFNTPDPNCKQPNPWTTAYDSDLDHCSFAYLWSINRYNYYPSYTTNYPICTVWPRRGFSTMVNPARVPLVMDKHRPQFGWVPNYFEWNVDSLSGYEIGGWDYAFRHPGRLANVVFMDGHVEHRRHYVESGQRNYVEPWRDAPPCGPGGECCLY
ncbi:prepilin-type N-terminal cleavage/methylation domain-containing protein [bacterium]|nr:prepilin-type N-terminal cleavage/methylation domain-containing protein [bacterium]